MKLSGKRVAVFVEKMFEDVEFWTPYYRLLEEGAEVDVIAPKGGESFEGKHGTVAKSDRAASDVDPDDYDGLVIPGGYSPDHMRRDPAMVAFTKRIGDAGKPVAAICHAGWMLASAGIAEGRRLTSYFSIRDDLVNAGADWVDEEVVVDGPLITSRSPDDLPAFCRTLVAALAEGDAGAKAATSAGRGASRRKAAPGSEPTRPGRLPSRRGRRPGSSSRAPRNPSGGRSR